MRTVEASSAVWYPPGPRARRISASIDLGVHGAAPKYNPDHVLGALDESKMKSMSQFSKHLGLLCMHLECLRKHNCIPASSYHLSRATECDPEHHLCYPRKIKAISSRFAIPYYDPQKLRPPCHNHSRNCARWSTEI